jgi:hypothetical protein
MTSPEDSASNDDMEPVRDEPSGHDNDRPTGRQQPSEDPPQFAAMVASGELPIPANWPSGRLRVLLNNVHELRRRRLVALIARAIASELCREQRQEDENVATEI